MWLQSLLRTSAPASVLLIRLMVGFVFFSEGVQKFLYPASRGVERFEKIGLPAPEALSYFVASFEIVCGVLLMVGLLTRLASLPTIAIMLVAIVTTKLPLLADAGFWEMAHEARTDWAMLLGSVFLLMVGAGPLSVDAKLAASDPEARKESA
jgi:putative oxidoreductase